MKFEDSSSVVSASLLFLSSVSVSPKSKMLRNSTTALVSVCVGDCFFDITETKYSNNIKLTIFYPSIKDTDKSTPNNNNNNNNNNKRS